MLSGWKPLQAPAFTKREKGQDLAEYGLLVGLIALAVVAGAMLLGQNLLTFWNSLSVPLPW